MAEVPPIKQGNTGTAPVMNTYKIEGRFYDVPLNEDEKFRANMKSFDKAQQVYSFTNGKDTFDVPPPEVESFLKNMPKVKALHNYDLSFLNPKPEQTKAPLGKIDQLKVDYFKKTRGEEIAQEKEEQIRQQNAPIPGWDEKSGWEKFSTGTSAGWKGMKGGLEYTWGVAMEGLDKMDGETDWDYDNRVMKSAKQSFKSMPRGKGVWYQLGSFTPQMIGIGAAALSAPFTAGTSAAAIPTIIGGANIGLLVASSAGGAMNEYDEYMKQTGQKSDYWTRLGVGIGAGGAEYLAERIGISRYLPEGVMSRAFTKFLSTEGREVAQEIAKTAVKTQPTIAGFVRRMGKNMVEEGAEESLTEAGQMLIETLYKNPEDRAQFEEWASRIGQAFGGGALMGGVLTPITYPAGIAYENKIKELNGMGEQTPEGSALLPEQTLPETPQDPFNDLFADPRTVLENQGRQRASDLASEDDGVITIVREKSTDPNIPGREWYVKKGHPTDMDGSMYVWDGNPNGESKMLTKKLLDGKPVELTQDEYVNRLLTLYDEQQKEQQMIQNNQMPYKGKVYSKVENGWQDDEFEAWQDDQGRTIRMPKKAVQEWKNRQNTQKEPPRGGIQSRVYGKTEYYGSIDEDGSFSISEPMRRGEVSDLIENVKNETGGKSVVIDTPVKDMDPTQPQYTIKVVPFDNLTPQEQENYKLETDLFHDPEAEKRRKEEEEKAKQPSYQFMGEDITRQEAEAVINLAGRNKDKAAGKKELEDLQYKNDPELDKLIEHHFPRPKPAYSKAKEKLTDVEAKIRIKQAKTIDELREIKIENDEAIQRIWDEKAKSFNPKTVDFSDTEEKKLTETKPQLTVDESDALIDNSESSQNNQQTTDEKPSTQPEIPQVRRDGEQAEAPAQEGPAESKPQEPVPGQKEIKQPEVEVDTNPDQIFERRKIWGGPENPGFDEETRQRMKLLGFPEDKWDVTFDKMRPYWKTDKQIEFSPEKKGWASLNKITYVESPSGLWQADYDIAIGNGGSGAAAGHVGGLWYKTKEEALRFILNKFIKDANKRKDGESKSAQAYADKLIKEARAELDKLTPEPAIEETETENIPELNGFVNDAKRYLTPDDYKSIKKGTERINWLYPNEENPDQIMIEGQSKRDKDKQLFKVISLVKGEFAPGKWQKRSSANDDWYDLQDRIMISRIDKQARAESVDEIYPLMKIIETYYDRFWTDIYKLNTPDRSRFIVKELADDGYDPILMETLDDFYHSMLPEFLKTYPKFNEWHQLTPLLKAVRDMYKARDWDKEETPQKEEQGAGENMEEKPKGIDLKSTESTKMIQVIYPVMKELEAIIAGDPTTFKEQPPLTSTSRLKKALIDKGFSDEFAEIVTDTYWFMNKNYMESPEAFAQQENDSLKRLIYLIKHLNIGILRPGIQYILDQARYTPRHKDSKIVRLEIDKVLTVQDEDYKVERGNENEQKGRIDHAKEFLQKNPKELEASIITFRSDGKIDFEDGRHRIIAAKKLGADYAHFEIKDTPEQNEAMNLFLNGKPFGKNAPAILPLDQLMQQGIEKREEKKAETPQEPELSPDEQRLKELTDRMRRLLPPQDQVSEPEAQYGSNPNSELMAIGVEMAFLHIKAGKTSFYDFARIMVKDLGPSVKPYLKSFYNGARDFPGMEEYEPQMDDYNLVKNLDLEEVLSTDSYEKFLADTAWKNILKTLSKDENLVTLIDGNDKQTALDLLKIYLEDYLQKIGSGFVAQYDDIFLDSYVNQLFTRLVAHGLQTRRGFTIPAEKSPEQAIEQNQAPNQTPDPNNILGQLDALNPGNPPLNVNQNTGLYIEDISDRAFVVKGNTRPLVQRFRDAGGIWQGGRQGWMFPKTRQQEIERLFGIAPQVQSEYPENKRALVASILDRIQRGERIINTPALTQLAQQAGLRAGIDYRDIKELYDLASSALNQHILSMPLFNPNGVPADNVQMILDYLDDLSNLLPTETQRSEEQVRLQQYSTPLSLAYLANWVAQPSKGETVLEPSAGEGNLAIFARLTGANVIVNEMDDNRLALLKLLGFSPRKADAKHVHRLPAFRNDKVTTVVMNPPFSRDVALGNTLDLHAAEKHIDAALSKLEQGGRLVAIVGRGMSFDSDTHYPWWEGIKRQYTVRANIAISGNAYRRRGTTFDNRMLVIDKTGATVEQPITGRAENYPELLDILKTIDPKQRINLTDENTARNSQGQAGTVNGGLHGAPDSQPDAAGSAPGTNSAAPHGPSNGHRPVVNGPQRPGGSNVPDTRGGRSQTGGGRPGGSAGSASNRAGNSPGTASGNPDGRNHGTHGVEGFEPAAELEYDFVDRTLSQSETLGYDGYSPEIKVKGSQQHPTPLVESTAMASVPLPKVNYHPILSPTVVKKGALSEAQLEDTILAGASHSQVLPSGKRRGMFLGGGTGYGKGRTIAAIILDNFNHGRKKAVWISANDKAHYDSIDYWKAVGGDPEMAFRHKNSRTPITKEEGVLLFTYGTLRTGYDPRLDLIETGDSFWTEAPQSRVQQLAQWLGKDYDGVIVFDEAHFMANAEATRGKRGTKEASQRALAGMQLESILPNARILYASATGATEVSNLAYATRLGLWGDGTPFANSRNFVDGIANAGLAGMEIIAKDLKTMGLYTARSISFEGVEYRTVQHKLTPEQRALYDRVADAWQIVMHNVRDAIEVTGSNAQARSAAWSAFWGAQQRFFQQVITTMQLPTLIENMQKDLSEEKSVVIQLISTNEAVTNRALTEARSELEEGEELDYDALDLSPKTILLSFLERSFPVTMFEEFIDDRGNVQRRILRDEDGNPVQDPELVAQRDALIDRLSRELALPEGPLDILINTFGAENVAEVTGRTNRIVKKLNDKGELVKVEERRSDSHARQDKDDFMDLKKRILIFSKAGGTGASFHSDLSRINQQQRSHYVLQVGWRADDAVQGFGRDHRANQRIAPIFSLMTTDLKAHMRFLSSVARRLDQLGAMSKGQRQAGGQGILDGSYNLEGRYAQQALFNFYQSVEAGSYPGIAMDVLEDQMALKIYREDQQGNREYNPDVVRNTTLFLNRLMMLRTDLMDQVFDAYMELLQAEEDRARANGTYDEGIVIVKASSTRVTDQKIIYTDPRTGGKTYLTTIEMQVPNQKITWQGITARARARSDRFLGYFEETTSERIYAMFEYSEVGADAVRRTRILRQSVVSDSNITRDDLSSKYARITNENIAQRHWEQDYMEYPDTRKRVDHIVKGLILPIWNRLPQNVTVRRYVDDNGTPHLGRYFTPREKDSILETFNIDNNRNYTLQQALDMLEAGGRVKLANGFELRKQRYQGLPVVQIGGMASSTTERDRMRRSGAMFAVTSAMSMSGFYYLPMDVAQSGLKSIMDLYNVPIISIKDENGQEIESEGGNIAEEPRAEYKSGKKMDAVALQTAWDSPASYQRHPDINPEERHGYMPDDATGEFTVAERLLTEQGHLTFMGDKLTGPARIKSTQDVAFLFKNLESAATENVFVVFIDKDENYKVLYISTGSTAGSVIDYKLITAAAHDFNAIVMGFVHNHPSGNLKASENDKEIFSNLQKIGNALGIHQMPSVIINLDSGKYLEFKSKYEQVVDKQQRDTSEPVFTVNPYQFDRQKLYRSSSEKEKMVTSQDVAEFLSRQKRGIGNKIQALILDRNNQVNRYVLLDGKLNTEELSRQLMFEVGKYGDAVILAANFRIPDVQVLKQDITSAGGSLLDVLEIKQDQDIVNNYRSRLDDGVMEPQAEYGRRPLKISDAGFYSTVEAALSKISQNKATLTQWKGMLLNNGAKPAEMDWMAWDLLDAMYDKPTYTREEILEWIDQNRIDVKEEVHGDTYADKFNMSKTNFDRIKHLNADARPFFNGPTPTDKEMEKAQRAEDELRAFSSGEIPFVSAKAQEKATQTRQDYLTQYQEKYRDFLRFVNQIRFGEFKISDTKHSSWVLTGGRNYKEWVLTMPGQIDPYVPDNIHFTDEGGGTAVAWIRGDDRDVEGQHVLFLEEVQSKRSQDGKEQGFVDPVEEAKYKNFQQDKEQYEMLQKRLEFLNHEFTFNHLDRDKDLITSFGYVFGTNYEGDGKTYLYKDKGWHLRHEDKVDEAEISDEHLLLSISRMRDFIARKRDVEDQLRALEEKYSYEYDYDEKRNRLLYPGQTPTGRVPNTPFKKTDQWVTLALRRMLRYAAQRGYDRLAWTSGQMQAQRYNLSSKVDYIKVEKEYDIRYVDISTPANLYTLTVNDQGIVTGNRNSSLPGVVGKHISEVTGKEVGEKILGMQEGKLSGLDLEVGGKGLKTMYDRIIPSNMRELLKPFGAKMETIYLGRSAIKFSKLIKDVVINSWEEAIQAEKEGYTLYLKEDNDYIPIHSTTDAESFQIYLGWENRSVVRKESLPKEEMDQIIREHTAVLSVAITPQMRMAFQEGMPLFEPESFYGKAEPSKNEGMEPKAEEETLKISEKPTKGLRGKVFTMYEELIREHFPYDPPVDVKDFNYWWDKLKRWQGIKLYSNQGTDNPRPNPGNWNTLPYPKVKVNQVENLAIAFARRYSEMRTWDRRVEMGETNINPYRIYDYEKESNTYQNQETLPGRASESSTAYPYTDGVQRTGNTYPGTNHVKPALLTDLFEQALEQRAHKDQVQEVLGVYGAHNLDERDKAGKKSVGQKISSLFHSPRTRMQNLEVAQKMEKQGKTPQEIRLATNWERGKDSFWRYEILDDVQFTPEFEKLPKGLFVGGIPLSQAITFPELFTAYPELKNVKISRKDYYLNLFNSLQGWFSEQQNELVITPEAKDPLGILLHEIQHWIQRKEGFARGGNMDSALKLLPKEEINKILEGAKKSVEDRIALTEENLKELDVFLNKVSPEDKALLEELHTQYSENVANERKAFDEYRQNFPGSNPYRESREVIDYKNAKENVFARIEEELTRITGKTPSNRFIFEIGYSGLEKLADYRTSKQKDLDTDKEALRVIEQKSDMDKMLKVAQKEGAGFAFEAYERLSGEVEARNVTARKEMSPSDRRLNTLESSEDKPRDEQIVSFESPSGSSMSANLPVQNPPLLSDHLENVKLRYTLSKKEKRTIRESLQGMREAYQDAELPVRRLEEEIARRGGVIGDERQPYRKLNLSKGRLETLHENFTYDRMKPIMEVIHEISKSGVPLELMLPYSILKHAPERNAYIRKRDYTKWFEKHKYDFLKWLNTHPEATQEEQDQKWEEWQEMVDQKWEKMLSTDYSGIMPLDINMEYVGDPDGFASMIAREVEALIPQELVDKYWVLVKAANEDIIDFWQKGRQISEETAQEYRTRYDYFVPLRGWRDSGEEAGIYYINQGSIVKSLQYAKGRKSLAENPLAYIQRVAFGAINEMVDYEIKEQLFHLVSANYEGFEDMYRIKRAYYVRSIHPISGAEEWELSYDPALDEMVEPPREMFTTGDATTVMYKQHMMYKEPSKGFQREVLIHRSKDEGGDVVIVMLGQWLTAAQAINHKNRMYRSIFSKELQDAAKWNKDPFNSLAYLSNAWKANMTARNAVFSFTNFLRDFQEGPITALIKGERPGQLMKNIVMSFPAALRGVTHSLDMTRDFDRYYDEFSKIGGITGYTHMKSLEQIEKDLHKMLRQYTRSDHATGQVMNALGGSIHAIEVWSNMFETATRLGVYTTARQMGKSQQEAGMLAKEYTINFNRGGKLKKVLDVTYAFLPVAIEGAHKNGSLFKRYPKASTAVTLGFVLAGLLEAMLNDWIKPETEDGEYYNITEYVRQNYWIIPDMWHVIKTGKKGDKYWRIPLPPFYRGFKSLGTILYDVMKGEMTPGYAAGKAISNFLWGLMPFDLGGLYIDGEFNFSPMAPTLIRPISEILENRNYMGYRIAKEPFTLDQKKMMARSHLHSEDVGAFSKFLTDALFRAGHGDNETRYYVTRNELGQVERHRVSPLLDWNPSWLDHLLVGYFGGTAKIGSDVITTLSQLFTPGEEVDFKNVPFVNAFLRKTPKHGMKIMSEYYKLKQEIDGNDILSQAYYRQKDYEEFKMVKADGYLNEYAAIIEGRDKAIKSLMKSMDFQKAEGSEKVIELMEQTLEQIKAVKEKYQRK